MAEVHVHPGKLPCDEESTFVVVLKHPLPQRTAEYSLTFKGVKTGGEILGRAVKVDQKTLICEVGAYGRAEEVEVRVVGLSRSVRVDPFRVVFCTRFQLICGLFPDEIPLQAPLAVACCLHQDHSAAAATADGDIDGDLDENDIVNMIDEELADCCRRNVPTDLSFKKFFGSDMVETMGGKANLLHFAAERGYKQFAAYLLAESGGAYDAMSVQNKRGQTPANIAESRGDEDITQLFIDYEGVAADNAVPLTEYADFQKLMSEYNYVKMEQSDAAGKEKILKKKKKSKKNLLGKVLKWKSENKGKSSAEPEQKKKKSLFSGFDIKKISRSIGARLETLRKHSEKNSGLKLSKSSSTDCMPSIDKRRREPLPALPTAELSEEEEEYDGNATYEDVEEMDMPMRPKSHYMKKIIAKGVIKQDYKPLPGDTSSFPLKKGQEVNIIEDTNSMWVVGECNGKEGRIMKSVLNFFDPDYEVDVGGAMYDESDDDGSDDDEEDPPFQPEPCDTGFSSGEKKYVATHDWSPQHDDDLKIFEGEILEVVEMSNSGWWKAKNSKGRTGTVPSTFLKEEESSPSAVPRGSRSSGGSTTDESVPNPSKFVKPNLSSSEVSRPSSLPRFPKPTTGPPVSSKKPVIVPPPTKPKANTFQPAVSPSSKPFSSLPRQPSKDNSELLKVLSKKKQEVESSSSSSKPKSLSTSSTSSSSEPPFVPPSPKGKKAFSPPATNKAKPPPPAKKPNKKEPPKSLVPMKPSVAVKPKKKNLNEYQCLWDYEPESLDDLRLRQGDIVVVTERSNEDWWIGECRGDKGVFPASFVEKLN
ncbi:uncharacterized protein [Oscarella lobularis]|uniref:uncharacterized protein n=1 Tax=Oscarella lobularis TaxID=121494 RepID=UPI003313F87B